MACFQRGELLRQPLPSCTSLRRRYFLSSRRSSHDVAASLLPVVAAPVSPECRDLLHSALTSGHLCQVRAARHCSFLDSVLELLTGNLPNLGGKKQRVVRVVTDLWLAPPDSGAVHTGGEFTYFVASHPLLPSASAAPQGSVRRDGLGSLVVSPCYAVSGGLLEVSYRFRVSSICNCSVPIPLSITQGARSSNTSLLCASWHTFNVDTAARLLQVPIYGSKPLGL